MVCILDHECVDVVGSVQVSKTALNKVISILTSTNSIGINLGGHELGMFLPQICLVLLDLPQIKHNHQRSNTINSI